MIKQGFMLRSSGAQLVLIVLGISLGAIIGILALRSSGAFLCQPAPEIQFLETLLKNYRDPCSEFDLQSSGEFQRRVHLNNFGLHGPDYTLDKPADVYRILIVGDSFPQGLQVAFEEGFPWRLQEALTQTWRRPVEVINLSMDAYGTDRELILYAGLGWRFDPDLVLLSIYTGNDIQDNQIDLETRRYGYRLDRPFFTLEAGGLRLHNSNFTVTASNDLHDSAFSWLAGLSAEQPPLPPENPPDHPTVTNTDPYTLEYPVELGLYLPEDDHWMDAWALTEALIQQFYDLTRRENIPLAAVIIPDRRAVHGEDWAETLALYGGQLPALRQADPVAPTQRLEVFLQANGIPTLNLVWALRAAAQSQPDERLYYQREGHFTPAGHRVAAERILSWLLAEPSLH